MKAANGKIVADSSEGYSTKQACLHGIDSPADLRKEGFLNVARWSKDAEEIWEERRTDKNQENSTKDYLNWRNKLTEQNLNAPYLVLYNSSAQDANATVVKRSDLDLEFIVDHVTYLFTTQNLYEAYYLTAILNSSAPNRMMKDFQARGLLGARHVHKKILDVYFPIFDRGNDAHQNLARISETAHQKVAEFLRVYPPGGRLTPGRLGRLRSEVKQHLEAEMKEIDAVVERIIA